MDIVEKVAKSLKDSHPQLDCCTWVALKTGAKAALQALDGELLYILDDNSEPRVGDIITYPIGGGMKEMRVFEARNLAAIEALYGVKIIQRNGLPCIYRTKLEQV